MEPFIVSARKYRPETFEDVVGQRAITQTLERAIASNHLAQALLFTGPRGVGKTTCARILAKKINHESGDFDPDEDFAFNIFELDAASNNGVDHIRSIVDQVRIPPQVGKYKVYIIDEVHMLSNAAFNAFLKTLEEPPAHAIFILATTEKHKIIPTILSRCQIFDFKRITVSAMREHLKRIAVKEGITADEDALQIIAQKADGALRDSLSIFDRVVSFSGKNLTVQAVTENLNVLDRDTFFRITDLVLKGNIGQLLIDFNTVLAKGFDGQHFVAGLASHFRDLMVSCDHKTLELLEVGDQTREKYLEQSKKTTLDFLRTAIEIASQTDFNYRASRNQRLSVELALMQLASINQAGQKKNDRPQIAPPGEYEVLTDNHILKVAEERQVLQPEQEYLPAAVDNPARYGTIQETVSNEDSKITTPDLGYTHTVNEVKKPERAPSPVSTGADAFPAEDKNVSPTDSSIEQRLKELLERSPKKVGGLSIKSIEVKTTNAQQAQKAEVSKDELPTEFFSQEQLDLVWHKYIQHLQERGQHILASILGVDKPKLKDEAIKLIFPNQSIKEDLEKSQGEVLSFLKRELNNYNIEFSITVNEKSAKKYVFTDQEKYAKLVEKNPAVDSLRKAFDLNF
ncbi:MAG: DNA polymerase III subunit gamma/tau [Nonlabens sp.]